jgi:prolyl oligopeptidase PreP (S9A serine peptidase family)
MARDRQLRSIILAAGMAGVLAGCAGTTMVGHPTPVPSAGRLDVPRPTATQIAVGANPNPTVPRMNPFVAQVRPLGGRTPANPYGWLQDVHSARTRHWILVENRATTKALEAIPQRAWIRGRLAALQRGGSGSSASDVTVERVSYIGPDGAPLPMEIAHRRDLPRDGNRPTLLTVYRSAAKAPGALLDPFARVWVEMGGVYARAEVREGLGATPAPRGAATLPDRSVALSDLFAAGQWLIDRQYTRRARLGIHGRGFAGLMAGAAVTLRPDFFGAALPTGTWLQYRQTASGNCFPPTLIVTAERGPIRPWEGYELAAVLQAEQICRHPILLRVERDESQEEPVAGRQKRAADELAFAARWLGARLPP